MVTRRFQICEEGTGDILITLAVGIVATPLAMAALQTRMVSLRSVW